MEFTNLDLVLLTTKHPNSTKIVEIRIKDNVTVLTAKTANGSIYYKCIPTTFENNEQCEKWLHTVVDTTIFENSTTFVGQQVYFVNGLGEVISGECITEVTYPISYTIKTADEKIFYAGKVYPIKTIETTRKLSKKRLLEKGQRENEHYFGFQCIIPKKYK